LPRRGFGKLNGFDTWLDLPVLTSRERPVPLTEGALDRNGTFQFVDTDGTTKKGSHVAAAREVQRREKPSSRRPPCSRSLRTATDRPRSRRGLVPALLIPDVGKERRRAFITELLELVETHRGLLEHFNYQMLKGILQKGAKLESLPFLEDGTPNVLIDEFSTFYIQRICLFKNSTHIIDIEETIRGRLAAEAFLDRGATVAQLPVRRLQGRSRRSGGGRHRGTIRKMPYVRQQDFRGRPAG
jgi:hypothetical protein